MSTDNIAQLLVIGETAALTQKMIGATRNLNALSNDLRNTCMEVVHQIPSNVERFNDILLAVPSSPGLDMLVQFVRENFQRELDVVTKQLTISQELTDLTTTFAGTASALISTTIAANELRADVAERKT